MRSAEIIVDYVASFYKPQSVVDVGAGVGPWLAAWKKQGVSDLLGLDDLHLTDEETYVDKKYYRYVNFEREGYPALKKYDLACNLEVAEHLDETQAPRLVEYLTSLSDVILFSAAMHRQGGYAHKNEQYPTYWRDLFASHDYVFLDAFREKFWSNEEIFPWYRQNMFLVTRSSMATRFDIPEWNGNIYVIPFFYENRCREIDELKVALEVKTSKGFKQWRRSLFRIKLTGSQKSIVLFGVKLISPRSE